MTATSAIIPASGLGKRFSDKSDKAFISIAGRPMLAHTLAVFQDCPEIGEIILVVRRDQVPSAEELVREYGFSKVKSVVIGGETRQDSVRNGLAQVSPECEIAAIHDGARPFVTCDIITASINAARSDGAAIVAVPVINTIKASPDGRYVAETLDREKLFAVQTPQTFKLSIIREAFDRAYADGFVGTDDASLVERLGMPVRIVQGSYENIKVTTPADMALAEAIIQSRIANYELRIGPSGNSVPSPLEGEGQGEGERPTVQIEPVESNIQSPDVSQIRNPKSEIRNMRVGHGYDIHRFAPGRRLFLGGVEFPGEEGLLGHSDADVLLHAVADSILGAIGADDIGHLFPNTDPAFKDASSMDLLAKVGEVAAEMGWCVGNIDVTLIAQRPKIANHVPTMRANIARALNITPEQVGVKATTAEGLGAIGEGLGIECHAVAMVEKDG